MASVWTSDGYVNLDLIKLGLSNSNIVPLGNGKYIIADAGRLQPSQIALANYEGADELSKLANLRADCIANYPDYATSGLKEAIYGFEDAYNNRNHEDMIYYGAVMDAEMMGYTLTKTTATTPQPGDSLVYLVFSENIDGTYNDYHWYVQNAPDTNGEITWSHKPGSEEAINSQPIYKYTPKYDNGNLMLDSFGNHLWDVEVIGGDITNPATIGANRTISYYYNLNGSITTEYGNYYNQYTDNRSGAYILSPK